MIEAQNEMVCLLYRNEKQLKVVCLSHIQKYDARGIVR